MVTHYATDAEIKAEFFRGATAFPSDNNVDTTTNTEWKTVISDHLDEVLGNTSGVRLTDRNTIIRRRFMKCYRRKLDEKDWDWDWELTEREQRELRHAWGKISFTPHHPQDHVKNE